MKIGTTRVHVEAGPHRFQLARNEAGVMHLYADDDVALAAAAGFAHALDRCVQLCMMRLIGEGRLSECLKATDETLGIDTFMRRQGFAETARLEVARLSPEAQRYAEAYVIGVNEGLRHRGRPWEFRLAGYKPEPWEIRHSLLVIKLMTYIGLAQCQQDIEKFIIEAVAGGVDPVRLRALFSPHLDGLTDELVALIGRLRLWGPTLPPEVRFGAPLPRMMASNNWAVAPARSASGQSLQANDPHLEVNRLPAIWYEFVARTPADYRIGVTIPGLPGLVMGRNRNVSFGFTYGYMDMVDHFIEDVRGQRCQRQGGGSDPVRCTKEIIRRKGGKPVEVNVFRSSVGLLEVDPSQAEVPDGLYLAVAYTAHEEGAAESFEALVRLPQSASVQETQQILEGVSVSANWAIADKGGHIGYQQTGFLPRRAHSGVHPLPAWLNENLWQGRCPASALLRIYDPPEGFIVSANGAHNPPGGPLAVNLHGGEYRRQRIETLLTDTPKLSVEDFKRIQTDLESVQAHVFLDILRPWVPHTRHGCDLLDWDGRYDVDSLGAPVFEAIYEKLLEAVFAPVFGEQAWQALATQTHLLFSYYNVFDRILLHGDESWFGPDGRQALFRRVLERTLAALDAQPRHTWGQGRRLRMKHILLGGQLPAFLGLDHGPIELPGTRATIVQGSVLQAYGRKTTFAPSYRFITDLGTDEVHTALAGGPSESPFGKWYTQDVKLWLGFKYKVLAAPPTAEPKPDEAAANGHHEPAS